VEAQAVINLVVVSLRGAPLARPMSAQFGPNGGTIGRAPTNTLVLDDPDRTVSRVHAQVECRGGQFFVLDRGSNPMQHNGKALGAGRETVLGPGDRLVVGQFELIVQNAGGDAPAPAADVTVPSPDDDPFADLLAGLGTPTSPPAAATPARKLAAPPAAPAVSDAQLLPDPFGLDAGKGPAGAASDPFADLLGPSPGAAPAAPTGAFDDFADLGLRGAPRAGGIDNLFGGTAGAGALGGDPFENTPLGSPLLQPNMSADADPFAALQATSKSAPAPRSDHVPIGQFGYTPPKVVPVGGTTGGGSLLDDISGQRIAGPAAGAKDKAASPAPDDDDPFADLMPGPPPSARQQQPAAPVAAPPPPATRASIAPAPPPPPPATPPPPPPPPPATPPARPRTSPTGPTPTPSESTVKAWATK
jgi:FHA domain-containing protein